MVIELDEIIDLERFPIFGSESEIYIALVCQIKSTLEIDGCAVLEGFIRPEFHSLLARQVTNVAHLAYDKVETVNVYNTDVRGDYPVDHPARHLMRKGNAFVARDMIDENAIIARLYSNQYFKDFISACFGLDQVFELADPYAGLCANVLRPGFEHPWHFDTNEFTVSMLTQSSEAGGGFEYCPNIRTPSAENMPDIFEVLTSDNNSRVRRLDLRPGDLQLFKGRYSLHRVSEVGAGCDRHSVIFAYSEMPGVIGAVERTRQLFGRVSREHYAAARA